MGHSRGVANEGRRPVQANPSVSPRVDNLPAQTTALVGREAEVGRALALLRRVDVRLATMVGPPGVGKTRLALKVAAELSPDFVDGVAFVALAPIADPGLIPSAIAQSLAIKEHGGKALLTSLKEALRERSLLLLLDNFEHVLPAAPVVADLLGTCPRLKLLVTSRATLRIYGEHEFPVQTLALPDLTRSPPLDELARNPCVELFVQRARAVRPDFALTPANARAVAEVCIRLDGLPLAIELAAARTKVLPPSLLLARLANPFDLLTGGARDRPSRQQTLRDSIAWSYDLLGPREQALFRRLAVFAGEFSLEAAEVVGQPDYKRGGENGRDVAGPGRDLIEDLTTLVDQSLLRQQEAANGEPRFAMLETIRAFGIEQLEAHGEATETRRRHATFFLSLAEAAESELRGPNQATWLKRLADAEDNLRAALAWALMHDHEEIGLRLAGALWHYWEIRGSFTEGRDWLERALARGGTPTWRARALTGSGTMAWCQGDHAQAVVRHREALTLYRELGDKRGIAFALNNLGVQALAQGEYRQAAALYEESLARYRELDDRRWIAYVLNNLGVVAQYQGDYRRATRLYQESLEIRRELGDRQRIADVLYNLGEVAHFQGDLRRAAALYQESLELRRELGAKVGIALCLAGLASVAMIEGSLERAARLAGALEAILGSVGVSLEPTERERFERANAAARAQLGEVVYAALRAEGRGAPLEEIVAYALSEPPTISDPARGRGRPSSAGEASYPAGLSPREVEVLRLVARGLTDREVADALVLSPRTVGKHLQSIYDKLGVSSRSAATRFAVEHGLT